MQGDLGARLSRAGLITRDQLREALASAPLHESALVMALVAGGVPDDVIADFFIYEGFGPLVTPEELKSADPTASNRLPHSMADSLIALPLRGDSSGWLVAMAAPSDSHSIGELARALGAPIVPVVARVGTLRAAIRAMFLNEEPPFASESEPPVLELVNRRTREWEGRPIHPREANIEAAPRLWVAWEDDDDGDDPPLLLVRTKAREYTNANAPSPPSDRVISKSFGRPDESRRSAASSPPIGVTTFDEHRGTADYVALGDSAETDPERWGDQPNVAHPVTRSVGPGPRMSSRPAPSNSFDFEDRVTAIHLASNRDDVVRLACEAGAGVARSTVFLVLRRGALEGFDARGGALSRETIRELVLPTSTPSKFRQVIESRKAYHGPYGTTIVDGIFRAAVESPGGNLSLHPVLVMDKIVGVLCADDIGDVELGVPRIELLAKAVGEAFRRLITQRA